MLTQNDLLVFDTSSLLDLYRHLYRHSIINSKRILNYIKKYEDIIWIPEQVKKEFVRNKDKAKNINMYKNFKKSTSKESEKLNSKLLKYINEYSKSGFTNLDKLEESLKIKFLEIENVINEYDESIKEESEIYKDFILSEIDTFLEELLKGEKVGHAFNIIELMNILKEGELRYRYKIAPGFEDEKNKIGVDKFGDLIVWKQIIRKASDTDKNNIYFITSDNKSDWFKLRSDNQLEPCKELIEEFYYYVENKEINIITMSNFIELISCEEETDVKLLMELRKEIAVKNIDNTIISDSIQKKVEENNLDILNYCPSDAPSGSEVDLIEVEDFNISNVSLIFEYDRVKYKINIEINLSSDVIVNDLYTIEHGKLDLKGNLDINIYRDIQVNEKEFIESLKTNSNEMIIIDNIRIEESEYTFIGDEDKNEYYTELELNAKSEMMDAMENYYMH